MKKIIYIVIAVLVLWGVWHLATKKSIPASTETIKIGVAASLTGYAENWGEGEVKAIQIALDDYKDKIGVPVELIIEDTKTTDAGSVSAVKKLIEIDHVNAIIGPTWADSFQGAMPLAENAKVAMLSPSSAIETLKNKNELTYFFSTWWPEKSEIETLLAHMEKTGVKKLAIVTDQDPFDIQIADLLTTALKSTKIEVGVRNTIPIATKDFRTQIAKIKSDKSTAVFVQLQDTSLMGPFMKQLKEQNVNILVYGTPDAENVDNITKFPGYFDGILYAFPSYESDTSYPTLVTKLKAKYGADASQGPSFVNAYNAAIMMFEVIKNGARTGTEIRDALAKVHVPGIGTKDLSFSSLGQIVDAKFIMKTIQNNQFMIVK